MFLRHRIVSIIFFGLLLSVTVFSQTKDTKSLEARRKALKQLLADEWEYELRENPEMATIIGDYRYNDRWSDFSLAHIRQQKRDMEKWLARFAVIDARGFPGQEKLN